MTGCCRQSVVPLVWLYSYSHQVFWLRMSTSGRPRGHWWLIFWALTDCVSNGALIAFAPPSLQTSPKKSIQIPTRKVAPGEGRSSPSLRYSAQRGIGLMCNLKSISLKKKKCPSYLRQHHLNINRASRCFTESRARADTDPRCFDQGFHTVYPEESGPHCLSFNFNTVPVLGAWGLIK